MISSYEIRENSLTTNSVFILLVKGDEEGYEDILQEFQDICQVINEKIENYDYVFELIGITDDYMLEKIKGRMEFLSSSVLGVSQTFDNKNKTETISIDNPKIKLSNTGTKDSQTLEEIMEETYTQRNREITLDLSGSGFVLTKENNKGTDFKEVNTNNTLIPEEDKKVDIEEDLSLRLAKTLPEVKQETPISSSKQDDEETKRPEDKEKEVKVEENQTDPSASPKEMDGVCFPVRKEKTGFFGNIFGKIKSAINSKRDNLDKKETTVTAKKQITIQDFLKTKKRDEQEQAKPIVPQKTKISLENKENSYQDMGEGLNVKNAILSEEETSPSATKTEKTTTNSVKAKLQVDDIFAAETLCDFYGNQPEDKKKEKTTIFQQQESPLDKLEKVSGKGEVVDGNSSEEKSSSTMHITGKDIEEQLSTEQTEKADNHHTENNSTETNTVPVQIFTQGSNRQESQKVVSKQENLPEDNKPNKEENSLPGLDKFKGASSAVAVKKKEEPMAEENTKTSLPGLDKFKGTSSSVIKKKTAPPVKEEKTKTSLPVLKDIGEKKKTSTFKKQVNKTEEIKKGNKEVKNKKKIEEKVKKEEKNMLEQKQNTDIKTVTKVQEHPRVLNNLGKVNSDIIKQEDKIDHTLHIATPRKNVKYRNYPIEMPLIPTYTFANMDISAIRFAHAMAMATLDDLGKSNNPFLVQGPSGTGKTHFLHALGYEISKKIPQSKILFTNCVRFSGQQERLDNFFNNAEVLILDDVHLTAVNEHNREYISKVLNDFWNNKKQIILSSKYPPESLKRFEELVNFKFSLGTVTELKVPNKAHFAKLTSKIVTSSFLDLTEAQVQAFFSDQNDSLGDVARNVKRVKVLYRMIESSGLKKMSYEDILKAMTAINGENDGSEIIKKDIDEVTSLEKVRENSWGNFGFFFPASHIEKFRWVAFAFQEAAKELGIKGGFNYALKSAYSTEHIISSAFKIANICDLKGMKGAIILGPSFMECKEPIRDNFYDILTHMLEVMMIRCGTINFEDIKKPSAYIKMLGDILK